MGVVLQLQLQLQLQKKKKKNESRQFADKTVYIHNFWRQFTDTFEDSSPTLF